MSRMIKFPSIVQFRNVVKNVQHRAHYVGKDAAGEAIYNRTAINPKLNFEGTVKLHGTNAAVGFDAMNGTMWCQSRENIITPEKDNAGFAMFATAYEAKLRTIVSEILTDETMPRASLADDDIIIFGEWCGGNIQAGVAITGLPKMFVIFGIAFVDAEDNKTYLTREQVERATVGFNTSHAGQIFTIYNFPSFKVEIDFENPHEIQNWLNEQTEQVEKECPVGKAFGVYGVGEGIVWRCTDKGYEDSAYWFKVKGAEHSKSKVKTLATVDVERINNIKELAERLANNGRLEQMKQTVYDTLNGGEVSLIGLGDFIKAVMQDIFKEDMEMIAASGFNGKEISVPVSKVCKDFIMKQLEV